MLLKLPLLMLEDCLAQKSENMYSLLIYNKNIFTLKKKKIKIAQCH